MNALRLGLVVVLTAGCTKSAPPPEPPADDGASYEASEESAEDEEQVEIDPSVRIEGPLSEAQVEAVVQEHFSDIQKCFDEALVRMDSGNLTGAIAVRMEIDGKGAVTSAEVEASNFGEDETPECIVGTVQAWAFPKAKKGEASTVVYPFFLRSY